MADAAGVVLDIVVLQNTCVLHASWHRFRIGSSLKRDALKQPSRDA